MMRTYFLDVPFESRGAVKGASYNKRLKAYTYTGESLPVELEPYHSADFSWLRMREDRYNKKRYPVTPFTHRFTPRPHQKEAAARIAKAVKDGYRGFIEGDGTGLGKTLSCIYGIYAASRVMKQGNIKVLVICPKPAIDGWSNTFKAFPLAHAEICIINYEQIGNLLKPPASAKNVKRAKTKKTHLMEKGEPLIQWDYIIADESHKLKNWDTAARAKAFGQVAQYQSTAAKVPFVIWASATIGQAPLELRYVFPLMKQLSRDKTLSWTSWLQKYAFNVRQTKTGSLVYDTPKKDASSFENASFERRQKDDLAKLNKLLFSQGAPSIRRTPVDIDGWPEINRIAFGSALSAGEYVQYQKEWMTFRSDMRLFKRGKNPQGALAKLLRFRQKSSMLRAAHTVEHAIDLLENGHQVAIYSEFMESIEVMRSLLEKKSYKVAEYTGANVNERELERLRFQRGHANVMLFSVDSAVSFHAGETLPDGSRASDNPRATIMHDVPYSGIKASQVEGRCHRDGKFAPVYYMYAVNTMETKVVHRMIERMQGIASIMDDEEFAEMLGSILANDNVA